METEPIHYRTIWISDIHLGTRGCQANILLDFLHKHESDTLYLVGDILDGWRLRSSWYFPQEHNTVIQKILRKSRKGTSVKYIIGNHDEFLRGYLHHGLNFGNIELLDEDVYEDALGKSWLVIHGDRFDQVVRYAKWLAFLGDIAYNLLLRVNTLLNYCRSHFGFGYWSLSAYLKHKVKSAVNFIGNYEEALANECLKRKLDGIISGHIHNAEIKKIGSITYINDGDFVESCTAIAEQYDGTFVLLKYQDDNWVVIKSTLDL